MEILRDTDFYREAHRVIFNAMLELYNKNEAVDMITVTEILKRDNKLEVWAVSLMSLRWLMLCRLRPT